MHHGSVVMETGELGLDLLRRRVLVRGIRVPLSLSWHEWEFLESLVLCYGAPVSREYLLACLHRYRRSPLPGVRSVDVLASKVRAKLAAYLGCSYIHAVRGMGYALRPPSR